MGSSIRTSIHSACRTRITSIGLQANQTAWMVEPTTQLVEAEEDIVPEARGLTIGDQTAARIAMT